MCDQTEVSYLEDDVVWVKIGPIWWPGVVKDLEKDEEGREILSRFKKKPIAVVKFFQEDNFEFVKNLDQIYHYSCRRKDEFIKKGLDKFRTGASHMKKFPDDVTTAETLTNGDINIINNPKFLPEKKESYSEIFGCGKKKKKESERTPNPRAKGASNVTPYRPITHQRFINKAIHGSSDHSVKTLIQSSASPDENSSKNSYKCHICKFETSRVNVIVAHHRLSHSANSINWTGSDSKVVLKKPVYKPRKIKSKKLFDTSKEDLSDDDSPEKKKSKTKSSKEKPKTPEKSKSNDSSQSPPKRKVIEEPSDFDPKKPRFTDVLLADWNEEEEDDKTGDNAEADNITDKKFDELKDEKENLDNKKDAEDKENKIESILTETTLSNENTEDYTLKKDQNEKMSCFDFDEEEEGFIGMSNANTYGRKIPRVIPIKDKIELGMDLEIEELFKRKPETVSSVAKEDDENKEKEDIETVSINESKVDNEVVSKDDFKTDTNEKVSKDDFKTDTNEKVSKDNFKTDTNEKVSKDDFNTATNEKVSKDDFKTDTNEKVSKDDFKTATNEKVSKDDFKTATNEKVSKDDFKTDTNEKVSKDDFKIDTNEKVSKDDFKFDANEPVFKDEFTFDSNESVSKDQFKVDTNEAVFKDQFKVDTNEPFSKDQFKVDTNEPFSKDQFKVDTNEPFSKDQFKVDTNKADSKDEFKLDTNEPFSGDEYKVDTMEVVSKFDFKINRNETNENDIMEKKEKLKKEEKDKPPAKTPRRRRSKVSKEEEPKGNAEDSLALRRTRRPGAKKSYLNEIIERIDDDYDIKKANEKKEEDIIKEMNFETTPLKDSKAELGSSSRRKQDFKHQTIDNDREEMIYSGIVNTEKLKTEHAERKRKYHNKDSRKDHGEDLSAQIDTLLEETKLTALPDISESSTENSENTLNSEDSKSNSFTFEYTPSEQNGKKTPKSREVKSISRMFADSIPSPDADSDQPKDLQKGFQTGESILDEPIIGEGSQSKALQIGNQKFSQSPQKRGPLLSTLSSTPETSGQVKILPVLRQSSTSKDCIILPSGKKIDLKKTSGDITEQNLSEPETSVSPKSIKTIKVKSDSIPPSLLASGKLKGQTIIHQKGGKYVIVAQQPPSIRPRGVTGKPASKVVILTNQLGEQKIITASNLAQGKYKATDADKDATPSASGSGTVTQPIIKMVPDGKGGIMKQLTVSPKKVILGGTKVLVSGSGTPFSGANTVQKIALAGSAAKTGGDFRLIENYKGSGKTVLIQGGSSATSGVVLKPTGAPRQVTKVIQNPQTLTALKKKPKILMRASTSQGEYLMQSTSGAIESPTYIVKQKGADGKFSAQKIVRTELVNQPKVATSATKTFFVAGQGPNKKGESFFIKTNDAGPGKVIRMRQKLKEVDASSLKTTQKIIQKTPETFAVTQNSSILIPSQTSAESETSQILQIQEQPQQPVLQTQVIAMPGPVGADGNQTYVLVSVDEHGLVQSVDNSMVAFDTANQQDQLFVNPTTTNNVILINPEHSEEATPVFSTSSQDILAEALANTNVLEGNINNEMEAVVPSILLPPTIPSSVVQETSITLQKPIMTPLEMPSSVAPDASVLEPPPLPPTPTDEDVLMEEPETPSASEASQEPLTGNSKKEDEEDTISSDPIRSFLESENFDASNDNTESSFPITGFQKENQKMFQVNFEDISRPDDTLESDKRENEFFSSEKKENKFFSSQKKENDFFSSEKKGDDFFSSDKKENEFFASEDADENKSSEPEENKEPPQEDFIIENSQEEQSTNSFQSMPLLNDEPDTSDDAQGSEPIADQQFDAQKSRMDAAQFSQLIREQEPPSSTNSDAVNDNCGGGFGTTTFDSFDQAFDTENMDTEIRNKDMEEKFDELNNENGEAKEKESILLITTKENQSLPVLNDENSVNTYDMDSIYPDVLSQKRIQEETEVSSTTDEYTSKNVEN